jgi:dipeptidyl aminopeptidase/acylaminoacyl peptidase
MASLVFVLSTPVMADLVTSEEKEVKNVPGVVIRTVEFWSDGTRLAGDLMYPKGTSEGDKLPCIVLCHGWGGVKAHLNTYIGPLFAKQGFVVFAFDYRGWGDSDSRLVVTGDMPKADADGMVTIKAQAIRELVDPWDQQEDIDAALTFVEGESIVDADRIGVWGSSFGGGHVIWRAANDDRVKVVVAQVGAMDQRTLTVAALEEQGLDGLKEIHKNKILRVRGELAPVPLDDDKPEGLVGSPYYERFIDFMPVEEAHKIKVPVMIIDAELEHYFDNKNNGHKVYQILKKNNVPVEYKEFEGMKHYDAYSKDLRKVMELEVPFFKKHLMGN